MAEVGEREKNHLHHHLHIHNHQNHQHIHMPMSDLPRDQLNRFMAANHHHQLPLPIPLPLPLPLPVLKVEQPDAEAEEEIELSLGLSMNGRFGVDPAAKKIKRTSSIPEFLNPVRDEEMGYRLPMPCTPLVRTCSLPTETEEELRKRKELQTLRRLEARRKRSEKQRNLKALRERNRALSGEDVVAGGAEGSNNPVEQGVGVGGGSSSEFTGGLEKALSLTSRFCGLGLNGDKEKGGSGSLPPPSPSQVSFGSSQGTGSSGNSETDFQQAQGTTPADTKSIIDVNLFPDGGLKSAAGNSGKNAAASGTMQPPAPAAQQENKIKDIARNLQEDMPRVSTKEEGPNGKRIEGFLYRYEKGEEVRIVCVCHGRFLTPSEFVKHGGGPDVPNPLKHIVVTPPSFS